MDNTYQLARCFKSEKFPSIRPNLIETIAHWLNNAIAEPENNAC
ncbi:MAG: hypothetical protein PX638_08005 [Microcystis sp. M53599_WE4]|nr:hypothetical protein [Microcystis sp. M53599_WE4]